MVKQYFKDDSSTYMFGKLKLFIKNQTKAPAKKIKMAIIDTDLKRLKNNMKNMSENETKNKKLDVLANFIEEVLTGDRMSDMPSLETDSEEEKLDIARGGKGIPELQIDENAGKRKKNVIKSKTSRKKC